jgi:hypothetical protein
MGKISCPTGVIVPGATSAVLTIEYTIPVVPPADYINPNATSVPWIHQGSTTMCSAYSELNAYDVTHGVTGQLPYNLPEIYKFYRNQTGVNLRVALGRTALAYGFNNYSVLSGNKSQMWDKIKAQTQLHGVTLIDFYTYANQYDKIPDGFLYPEPVGNRVNAHWVAVVGYNNATEQIYFLDSRELSYQEGYQIRGMTKSYWLKAGEGGLVPY